MNFPFELSEYIEFCKPNINRQEFIQLKLKQYGINFSNLLIDGKKHIYVDFAKNCYDSRYKIKTLVAHYDRVEGTSGANDNSSGVFALLCAAKKIAQLEQIHNVRIIFTDGEEQARYGITSQGAFSLSKKLKELNCVDGDFFVFDCVGRGDVPVICELELPNSVDRTFARKYLTLINQLKNIISKAANIDNVILPSSFSDNAGFVANRIPAVAITMLPKDEVLNYMSALKRIPGLRESVMHRKLEDIPDKVKPEYVLRESIPLTWKYIHTQFDNYTTLTPIAFMIVSKIIDEIVKNNYLK